MYPTFCALFCSCFAAALQIFTSRDTGMTNDAEETTPKQKKNRKLNFQHLAPR